MIREFVQGLGRAVAEFGEFAMWSADTFSLFLREMGPFLIVVIGVITLLASAVLIAGAAGELTAQWLFAN
jgi:uncharacterized membrane protein